MPIIVATASILAGGSLSSAVDCTNGRPAIIAMPTQWNEAQLSFQVSHDDAVYFDLYTSGGLELICNVVRGNTAILLDAERMQGIRYVKLRSGAHDNPIPQQENRDFYVILYG